MGLGAARAFQNAGAGISDSVDRLQQIIMQNRQKEQQRYQNELTMADAQEGVRQARVREDQGQQGLDLQGQRLDLNRDQFGFEREFANEGRDIDLFTRGLSRSEGGLKLRPWR